MVKISTESTADLDQLFGMVDVMPLFVDLDGQSYLDGIDIKASDIFDKYEEKKILPKTAARSISDYVDFFNDIKSRGADEIVHISISSKLSASYSNACNAAAEVGGVFVVDSRSLSTGIGLLVLKAMDAANSGQSAQQVAAAMEALTSRVQASFVVDTMEYLHKGGRCGGLARLIAGILKIKPMLILSDGNIVVGQKFMGSINKSIEKYVEAILRSNPSADKSRAFVTHTYADPELVLEVKAALKKAGFNQVIETKAGCTVTAHCGKGTLGVLFING